MFKGVNFCLCEDVHDTEDVRRIVGDVQEVNFKMLLQVKRLLVDGGGKLVNYMSDIVTHLVADNDEHPDVAEALEIYEKPVVTVRYCLVKPTVINCSK